MAENGQMEVWLLELFSSKLSEKHEYRVYLAISSL